MNIPKVGDKIRWRGFEAEVIHVGSNYATILTSNGLTLTVAFHELGVAQ